MFYLMFLYDKLMRGNQLSNKFHFVSSSRVEGRTIVNDLDSVTEHLVERFMASRTENLYPWAYNTIPTGLYFHSKFILIFVFFL